MGLYRHPPIGGLLLSFLRCDKYSGVDSECLFVFSTGLPKVGGQPFLSINIIPYSNAIAFFVMLLLTKRSVYSALRL